MTTALEVDEFSWLSTAPLTLVQRLWKARTDA
jgi:hypothetical protein